MSFSLIQAIRHHNCVSCINAWKLSVNGHIDSLIDFIEVLRCRYNLVIKKACNYIYTGLVKENTIYIINENNRNESLEIGAVHFHQHQAFPTTPFNHMAWCKLKVTGSNSIIIPSVLSFCKDIIRHTYYNIDLWYTHFETKIISAAIAISKLISEVSTIAGKITYYNIQNEKLLVQQIEKLILLKIGSIHGKSTIYLLNLNERIINKEIYFSYKSDVQLNLNKIIRSVQNIVILLIVKLNRLLINPKLSYNQVI